MLSRSTFLSFVTATAAGAAATLPARAQATTLRVGAPMADSFAEPWYGKESGIFERAGFDLQASSMPFPSAIVAAISGGGLDLGVCDMISTAEAFGKGVPIALLGLAGLYLATGPTAFLVVAKDSPIQRPRDLIGKTVGLTQLSGLSTAALKAWLAQNNIDFTTLHLVEVPVSAIPAAIARGTIDTGVLGEPFYTANKSSLRDIGHPLDAIGKAFANSAWFASRTWIEADRERARRLVEAIYATGRWANSHHAATMTVLVREGKLNPDQVYGMARTPYATSAAVLLDLLQPILGVAAKFNLIDKPIEPSAIVARL
jgi:ABC-type nitrate/sulfonate/bicarbonate transport system substrate-binding protein